MTQFGLDETTVAARVRGVRGGNDHDAAESFARAAWTGIAEPGDSIAGLVVQTLGAVPALNTILESPSLTTLAGHLRAAGVDITGLEPDIARGLDRWVPRLKSTEVIHFLAHAERVGARLLLPGDPLWPDAVNDLGYHAPLALWWRGIPAALEALARSISLVGARAATGYGKHVAMEASAGLVDRGFAIVSGAAFGIDGMAHQSALASDGLTVAFLAGGADRFYPSGHDALLRRMVEVGAVLAELPCGSMPTKWRFLQRNRLIAAASNATVVLEAGWRSGSLNTANHAASLGRPLGAVPGPVTSPTSAGCHRLIRENDAVCVTDAAEMAELAGDEVGSRNGMLDLDLGVAGAGAPNGGWRSSDEIRALDALSRRSPRPILDIARRAGLSTSAVIAALGSLQLDGIVLERQEGWLRGTG